MKEQLTQSLFDHIPVGACAVACSVVYCDAACKRPHASVRVTSPPAHYNPTPPRPLRRGLQGRDPHLGRGPGGGAGDGHGLVPKGGLRLGGGQGALRGVRPDAAGASRRVWVWVWVWGCRGVSSFWGGSVGGSVPPTWMDGWMGLTNIYINIYIYAHTHARRTRPRWAPARRSVACRSSGRLGPGTTTRRSRYVGWCGWLVWGDLVICMTLRSICLFSHHTGGGGDFGPTRSRAHGHRPDRAGPLVGDNSKERIGDIHRQRQTSDRTSH